MRLRPHDTLHRVRRVRHPARASSGRRAAAFDATEHFGWVALDTAQTRAVASVLRTDYKLGGGVVRRPIGWKRGAHHEVFVGHCEV